jgi:hypothetical protein
MTDQNPAAASLVESMRGASIAELDTAIDALRALRASKDQDRKRDTAAQIRRLARESGLNITIGKRPRRRGRPSAK